MKWSRRDFLAALNSLSLTGLSARAGPVVAAEALAEEAGSLDVAGRVFWRGGSGYEEQRRFSVWQALKPERYPDGIVQANSEDDIVKTVRFARARNMTITVKGSGHSFVSSHLPERGIMLDVSRLNGTRIDESMKTAWIGPGVRSGELAHVLGQQGLGFPVPHCVTVALGGYLLGGGMGWNNEPWNDFACFNIEAVDVITAEGEKITASRDDHPDLFWAARGVGPSFCAVATRFHLRVFPLPRAITASTYRYPIEELEPVSRWLESIGTRQDRKVELSLIIIKKARENPGSAAPRAECIVSAVCFVDEAAEAGALLGRVLEHAPLKGRTVIADRKPRTFAELSDPGYLPQRMVNETAWTNEPGKAIRMLGEHIVSAPADSNTRLILGFRVNDSLPKEAAYTAIGRLFVTMAIRWNEPAADAENHAWLDAAVRMVDPITVASYINESDFMRRPERKRLYMPAEHWQRLAEIRNRYDPHGLFPPPRDLLA
jgi:FAD/FMN-containing dehydrogenase